MERHNKYITIGILAHVDAGKTTLSESILYLTGQLRTPGRVDHKDAFLDTYELEKNRGITIFSKQAVFGLGDSRVTLLDTPGHVDFSAEMERTLQVLDYAVLVISGADGVQGHTRTLWRLLRQYQIPVFLFVNKMDQQGTDREEMLKALQKALDDRIIAFDSVKSENALDTFYENVAMCDEQVLETYLQDEKVTDEEIIGMIRERKIFPCYFGSALKIEGVQELLNGIQRYAKVCQEEGKKNGFGAKVFKISRDSQGNRLTHLKITNGILRVKDMLSAQEKDGERWEEKVNQIRIYSGEKYEMVSEASSGMVCAVTGLTRTYPGEGLGTEGVSEPPRLSPVLNYRVLFPESIHVHTMLSNLRQIEEEDPLLRVVWNEELGEIYVQLMGEVQTEVLQSMVEERFGVKVSFDSGNIVYKETIRNMVEGIGHYEPLRHYAEVHLILEPGIPGSGLVFDSNCSGEMLDKNWQRLILTHLAEKHHRGVLMGAEITDMKITLAAGRAHLKHTEGGDFRQSTYRAVRQGLMKAESVLLEPYYEFRLTVPSEMVGRALTDVQRMYGEFTPPATEGSMSTITGSAPVSEMRNYPREVANYTHGEGELSLVFQGYAPCHNTESVLEEAEYDPLSDMENPVGSVFCSHGAGFYVAWDQVEDYMHVESQLKRWNKEAEQGEREAGEGKSAGGKTESFSGGSAFTRQEEQELEEIFIRTYGKIERKNTPGTRTVSAKNEKKPKRREELPEYLLVDGYNVIFAWEDLKEFARDNIEAARNKLMDIMCNYQGYKKCTLILVFDAYKVEGSWMEIQKYHNIHVVYTKEAETADQYIEKVVHTIGRKYHVTVATSDGVEQVITVGQGASLISARELEEVVEIMKRELREQYLNRHRGGKNYLFDHMEEGLAEQMERIRLGEEKDFASEES